MVLKATDGAALGKSDVCWYDEDTSGTLVPSESVSLVLEVVPTVTLEGRNTSASGRRINAADPPKTAFQRFLANLTRWISGTIVVSLPPADNMASKSAKTSSFSLGTSP